MSINRTFSIVIVALILISFHIKNEGLFDHINAKLAEYNLNHPQEKIYLHFDKPYYSLGEDIWFNVYLVEASGHTQSALSKVVYVELISPDKEVIEVKIINVYHSGAGDFRLNQTLPSGEYTVRAYTSFMRNFDQDFFFTKSIRIWDTTKDIEQRSQDYVTKNDQLDIDLQFFPEGGYMVNGLLNYVAFKAISTSGLGVDLSGYIENNRGEKVMDFNSSVFGMGKFILVPKPSETYTAKVAYNGKTFEMPLPEAKVSGVVIHIEEKKDQYRIMIQSNKTEGIGDVLIVGQQRSQIFCNVKVSTDKRAALAIVEKTLLKNGIGQFTLFNDKGQPLCERLVFNFDDTSSPSKLEISGLKNTYSKREKVNLTLNFIDTSQVFKNSKLSITVTDNEVIEEDSLNANIQSYLLLSSDIKGFVESPSYYFNQSNSKRVDHLDILMLTQGWRRFTWDQVLYDSTTQNNHILENGLSIKGRVTRYGNRSKSESTKVTLSSIDAPFIYDEIETDNNGEFMFTGYDFTDSLDLILQAKKISGKNNSENNGNYFIEIDGLDSPPIANTFNSKVYNHESSYMEYIDRSTDIFKIDSVYKFDTDVIILEGISIKAKKSPTLDPFSRAGTNYTRPDARVVIDSLPGAKNMRYVFDIIQGNLAGVIVSGSFPNYKVKIRGNNSINGSNQPLFILNGMPIDYTNVFSISPSEIEFIDVLKGPAASAYGIRGASGVIAMYTKLNNPDSPKIYQGIVDFTHPGFDISREFYHPKYNVVKQEHVKPDYRTTLYWNPNINLENGKSKTLEFFTSDIPSTYRIEIEGITESGNIIMHESYFTTE